MHLQLQGSRTCWSTHCTAYLDFWWWSLRIGHNDSHLRFPSCGSLSASRIFWFNSSSVGSIKSHPAGGFFVLRVRTFGIGFGRSVVDLFFLLSGTDFKVGLKVHLQMILVGWISCNSHGLSCGDGSLFVRDSTTLCNYRKSWEDHRVRRLKRISMCL